MIVYLIKYFRTQSTTWWKQYILQTAKLNFQICGFKVLTFSYTKFIKPYFSEIDYYLMKISNNKSSAHNSTVEVSNKPKYYVKFVLLNYRDVSKLHQTPNQIYQNVILKLNTLYDCMLVRCEFKNGRNET